MIKRLTYLICIILSFLSMNSCIFDERPQEKELSVGDMLPEFSATMNDGSVVTRAWLSGSVSCIVFFHTSCPDCQKTLPVIQRIYDEYSSKGVRFALISREEGESSISAFWEENGLTMPYSAQTTREIYNKFAQTRVPRVYISDSTGKIRTIHADDPVPEYDVLIFGLDDAFGTDKE